MLLNTFFLLKCLNRSLLYKLQCLNTPVPHSVRTLLNPFFSSVVMLQLGVDLRREFCTKKKDMQNANEAYEIFRFIDFDAVFFALSVLLWFRKSDKRPIASLKITLL